jgi:hypothetical protein
MSDFIVPDMIEPIVAWRCWRFDGFSLRSVNNSSQWPKKERMEARCSGAEPSTHHVVGWEAVSTLTGESFWLRDELAGEGLAAAHYGHTGATGVYHPVSYATSAVMIPISTVEHVKPPEAPSGLVLPDGWEFRVGTREYMLPPAHSECPSEDCTCGLYALSDRDLAFSYRSDADVCGEIYLWGKTILGENGYRAQYAYPKALESRVPIHAALLEYGVPVTRVGAVQVAMARLIPKGRMRWPSAIAMGMNLFAILWTTILFSMGVLPWLNFALLVVNVAVLIVMLVSSVRR